jgi:hypothetical protein
MNFDQQIIESFSGYDSLDEMAVQFYDCVLAIDVGDYVRGTTIPNIAFNFQESKCTFYDNDGNEMAEFKIKVTLE